MTSLQWWDTETPRLILLQSKDGYTPKSQDSTPGTGWQSRKAEGTGPGTTHEAGLAAGEKRPSQGTGLGDLRVTCDYSCAIISLLPLRSPGVSGMA